MTTQVATPEGREGGEDRDGPGPVPDRTGGALAASAVIVMNLTTYGFTMVAARLLGPQPYGALAAVMNVLLVASVLSLALQASAARRIAAAPLEARAIADACRVVGTRTGLVAGAVLVVAAPWLNRVLALGGLATAVFLAAAVVPTTVMGPMAGALQGERRWRALALLYLAVGVPRFAVAAALLWRPSESVATLGVALAAVLPVVVGRCALGPVRRDGVPVAGLWAEVAHSAQALLAFLVLSNLDVLVARSVLDRHEAGLYAGGLILTKAVVFLPQFVVVLAFPAMGSAGTRRRAVAGSLGLTAVAGAAAVLGAELLPGLAMTFLGGAAYADIRGVLWQFAVLGLVLALIQLLVYSVLADGARWPAVLVWVGLVALGAGASGAGDVESLLGRVIAADLGVLVPLLAATVWRLRPVRPVGVGQDPSGRLHRWLPS